MGGDVDTSGDAADDASGEEGVEDADDELEQAAEDVLGKMASKVKITAEA